MLGGGLGYKLTLLCERLDISSLVLIEPDSDLFYASLHANDWAALLEHLHQHNCAFNLLIGQSPEQLFTDMHLFYQRHGLFLPSCRLIVHGYHSPELTALEQALERDYQRHYNAVGFFDDVAFGAAHALSHLKAGTPFLRAGRHLSAGLQNVPCAVVGNGPSLDFDLPWLRRHQEHIVICACGTAIESLYRAGIAPDFYCVTERLPQIADLIAATCPDESFRANVTLLATDVVHPRVTALFPSRALFLKPAEMLFAYARKLWPQDLPALLDFANPLVGNTGLSAMLALGFKELYLFGLDCGVSADAKKTHSAQAQYYNFGENTRKANALSGLGEQCEGNFGGRCCSSPLYAMCARLLELALASHPEIRCFNCSRGRRIAGASALESALIKIPESRAPKQELQQEVRTRLSAPLTEGCTRFQSCLENLPWRDTLARLDEILKGACQSQSRPACTDAMIRAHELSVRSGALHFLFGGTLQSLFIQAQTALYQDPDEKSALLKAHGILTLSRYFLEDAGKVVLPHLKEYVMGEQRRFLGSQVGLDHAGCPAPNLPAPELDTFATDIKAFKAHHRPEPFVKRYD